MLTVMYNGFMDLSYLHIPTPACSTYDPIPMPAVHNTNPMSSQNQTTVLNHRDHLEMMQRYNDYNRQILHYTSDTL